MRVINANYIKCDTEAECRAEADRLVNLGYDIERLPNFFIRIKGRVKASEEDVEGQMTLFDFSEGGTQ